VLCFFVAEAQPSPLHFAQYREGNNEGSSLFIRLEAIGIHMKFLHIETHQQERRLAICADVQFWGGLADRRLK
jgi:hypothetical protein